MAGKRKRRMGAYETTCQVASRNGLPPAACAQILDMVASANRRLRGGYKLRVFVVHPR